MLSWAPDTNHIGVYVAKNKGYFKQAGLDVDIVAVAQAGGYVVSFFASARVSAVVGCVIAAYYQLLLSMGLGEWDSSHRLTQEHSRRMGQRLALSQRRGTVLLVW